MSYFNIQINWDFDSSTKNKYFFPEIEAYSDIDICLSSLRKAFFEINAKNNITISFAEATDCRPILIDNLKFPFIYFRNVGCCNILINSSQSIETYETSLINKTNYISDLCYNDYLIKPKENVLLTFCSSQDGQFYFSKSKFPFGFFYKTNFVKEFNSSGIYPICCFAYQCEEIPTVINSTGICQFNYLLTCNINDYKWNFINYYYRWSGNFLIQDDQFENKIFYSPTITGLIDLVINYSSGEYCYQYIRENCSLVKENEIINLTGLINSCLNCYFLYNENFYDYDSQAFTEIIGDEFLKSGFTQSGELYLYNGICCCNYLFSYSGFDCNITYCPTYLYEELDSSFLNQYSGSGYDGFIFSNYFSGHIDSGVQIEISTVNKEKNILDPIYLKSSNENLDFCSEIYSSAYFQNQSKIFNVSCDLCVNLLYKLNVIDNLFYKYQLETFGDQNNLIKFYDSYGNFLFCSQNTFNKFCLIKLTPEDEDPFINFKLKNISTSGLNFKNFCSNCYVLPTFCDFDYEYSFYLKNQNQNFETSQSGWWGKKENFKINCINKNSICFISTGENYYLNNKPEFYCLDLNIGNSEIIFTDKSVCCFSNDFEIKKQNIICSFYFCCLEYRYNPIDYILYNGNKIYLPDSGIDIHLHLPSQALNFTFPVLALEKNQIFINSDLKFINNYSDFELHLCYDNFVLNSCFDSLNKICIPKIKKYDSQNYEIPDLKLTFSSCRLICENLNLCASLNTIYVEPSNNLYNFYLYLYSFFNLSSNDILSLEGLKYGSDECKFAFMNLERKLNLIDNLCFPDVFFCQIKNETFSGYNDSDIFPYKFNSGIGYSYGAIILNEIEYIQNLDNASKCFKYTGLLSRVHVGKDFDNNNIFYIYSCSGNIKNNLSYIDNNISRNGYGQIGNCFFELKIGKENMTGYSGLINLNNCFLITGVQPFSIKSDSTVECIVGNLLYNNYIDYNNLNFKFQCNDFDSIFYYTYPFSGFRDENFNIKIKENCFIQYVEVSLNSGAKPFENQILWCDRFNPNVLICNNFINLCYPLECSIKSNYLCDKDYINNKINIITCR